MDTAKEKGNVANKRLGKAQYRRDPRTISLAAALKTVAPTVVKFQVDEKKALPVHVWGNDQWGDCVFAGRANHFLVLEYLIHRSYLHLNDQEVIDAYKAVTHSQTPGDANDQGYEINEALKLWRKGWKVHLTSTPPRGGYKLAAYGELDRTNLNEMQAAIQFLGGIELGFGLPQATQGMQGTWDVPAGTDTTQPQWQPYSWGGHAVYAKGFDHDNITIRTWGEDVTVTPAFMRLYCDEAWAAVPSLDSAKFRKHIDVPALKAELVAIGATNIG